MKMCITMSCIRMHHVLTRVDVCAPQSGGRQHGVRRSLCRQPPGGVPPALWQWASCRPLLATRCLPAAAAAERYEPVHCHMHPHQHHTLRAS